MPSEIEATEKLGIDGHLYTDDPLPEFYKVVDTLRSRVVLSA